MINAELLAKAIKIAEVLEGGSCEIKTAKSENGRYVIARTHSAGVFAGNIESRNGQEVVLRDARRLWKWAGAASLSELAWRGTSNPKECMFPVAVNRVELLQVIEILDVTSQAERSIKAVPIWTK